MLTIAYYEKQELSITFDGIHTFVWTIRKMIVISYMTPFISTS